MGCCATRSETVAERAHVSLKDRVAIVTGANSGGLGQYTAQVLAQNGCKVVMVGRAKARLESSANEIRQVVPAADLICLECDLASLASVRKCAQDFLALNLPLHLLINNGGVMACPYTKSVDGFELQMATNHLGHFLLTFLLLDKLKASDRARVVCVSSGLHVSANMDAKDPELNTPEEKYGAWSCYGNSKLANILHAKELSRRLKGTNVTAYSLHPGVIPTKLSRNNGCATCYSSILGCCQKNISQGSATTVYLAMTPNIEHLSGAYFSDCHEVKPTALAEDANLAATVWERSMVMCGLN